MVTKNRIKDQFSVDPGWYDQVLYVNYVEIEYWRQSNKWDFKLNWSKSSVLSTLRSCPHAKLILITIIITIPIIFVIIIIFLEEKHRWRRHHKWQNIGRFTQKSRTAWCFIREGFLRQIKENGDPPFLPLMNIYFSVHFHNSSNCFWFFHYETLDCFASLLENLELPIFTHCTVSAGDVNPNFPHCTEFINISQLWQLHIFTWIWQTEQSVICFVKFVLFSQFNIFRPCIPFY